MALWAFGWGLVTVFVVAENKDQALHRIRQSGSVARTDYPRTDFDSDPDCIDSHDIMITHYGWD